MIYSPILHALLALLIVFYICFWFFPPEIVHQILDAYCIAAAALVVVRYHRQIWRSLRNRNPDGADCLYFSIGGVAFSIAALRFSREFGWDFGFIQYVTLQHAFAMITVVMMFSLFLKVIAPPVPFRPELSLGPWAAFALAIGIGSILAAISLFFRSD